MYGTHVLPLDDGGFLVAWVPVDSWEEERDIWARRVHDTDEDGTPDFVDPAPLDPNIPGECSVGSNVVIADPINWAAPVGQSYFNLSLPIRSAEFTTTSNPGYAGQVAYAPATGTSHVQRAAWISSCPGGPPLDNNYCYTVGAVSMVLRWTQQPIAFRCNLETDTTYYLNAQNIDCAFSSCGLYQNLYHNGMP